ncbi:MAG TPA: ABC transporter permease [Lentimicrobium sp.]|nr:ABC transporter permease [Lentimicrobium sp.]
MKTFIPPDDCSLGNIDAPCFRNLLPEEIDLARNSKTRVIFRKGENLTKQGAFASSVLFIMDGLAKQYVEGDATRNFNLRLLKGGEFVGLSVAFNNHTYQYSVVALRETTACLIEKEAVTSLIKAAVFAGLISAIGCQRGFQVRAGAQDVGKFTTSAVVAAIFLIVVADSIFAIMLYYVKLYGIFA